MRMRMQAVECIHSWKMKKNSQKANKLKNLNSKLKKKIQIYQGLLPLRISKTGEIGRWIHFLSHLKIIPRKIDKIRYLMDFLIKDKYHMSVNMYKGNLFLKQI